MWTSLKRTRWPLIGMCFLIVLVLAAFLAPWLAPHDPTEVDIRKRLRPPAWADGSLEGHPLGTDPLGQDVLSRLISGARISLIVGASAVVLAGTLGVAIGLIAGYSGGWVDSALMRLADIQMGFPFILLALTVMAVVGPGLFNLILVLGLTNWVPYARVVRGEVMGLRDLEYVQAAEAIGNTPARVIVRHIFPNVLPPVMVIASFAVATTILAEAALSFLGLGLPPTIPTWGGMLAQGREFVYESWWLTVFPGMMIFLSVLSINFIGDWLRDYLDPRLEV